MKKTVLLVAVILLCSLSAGAQDVKKYGRFDFELGFEAALAAPTLAGATNSAYPFGFHIEGRWQIKPQPIDVGFHIGLSVFDRKLASTGERGIFRTMPIMAVADWQFGRGKRINPYAGLGAGISMNDGTSDDDFGIDSSTGFAISPRVGVRCFKFMNLGLGYLFTDKGYSRLYMNLGFYF